MCPRYNRRAMKRWSLVALPALGWGLAVALAPRSAPPSQAPLPVLPAEGGLAYECRDADSGAAMPCKLTLVGVDGTPRPALTHGDIGRQEGDAIAAHDR